MSKIISLWYSITALIIHIISLMLILFLPQMRFVRSLFIKPNITPEIIAYHGDTYGAPDNGVNSI